jgi:hypothetical protein
MILSSMVVSDRLQVDSQLFEHACDHGEFERACRLYLGDFLEGFSASDSPQFDEWAFFRREALRGRAIQALERVVQLRNRSPLMAEIEADD